VDGGIHLGLDGNVERIKQLKEPPDPNAIAIIAPGENAMTVGLIGGSYGRPFPGPVAELFDVEGHIDRQPCVCRPTVVWACRNIGVVVAAVSMEHQVPPRRMMSRMRPNGRPYVGPALQVWAGPRLLCRPTGVLQRFQKRGPPSIGVVRPPPHGLCV